MVQRMQACPPGRSERVRILSKRFFVFLLFPSYSLPRTLVETPAVRCAQRPLFPRTLIFPRCDRSRLPSSQCGVIFSGSSLSPSRRFLGRRKGFCLTISELRFLFFLAELENVPPPANSLSTPYAGLFERIPCGPEPLIFGF